MQDRNSEQQTEQQTQFVPSKRGRGRPKGSKNKPKFYTQSQEGWDQEAIDMTKKSSIRPRSEALHRKWQREWVKPHFALSRKEAYEIFFSYLRSARGKEALKDLIVKGSPGVGKLSDSALAKYLEQTNLLSRYPHEVVIRG